MDDLIVGRPALAVVDMQNDFCAENGYIHTTQGADMSGNKPLAGRIGKLVEAARDAGAMVVWIKAIYDHELLPAPMLSKMLEKGKDVLAEGRAVGKRIGSGKVNILKSIDGMSTSRT